MMNKGRIGLLLAIVVAAALLIATVPRLTMGVAAGSSDCAIQGSWIGYLNEPPDAPTLIMQETVIPLDPEAKTLAYVGRAVNPDETFFGLDVKADYLSELVGEAVWTKDGTYDYSAVAYGVKKVAKGRDEIRYIWVLTGSMQCEDATHKTDTTNIQVFLASQDADGDGFPDEGEVPFLCLPEGTFSTARRMPLMSACEPPPP